MADAIVKLGADELSEVKDNVLMLWGDLESVDEGMFHADYNQVNSHIECAFNHVDYLWYLFTGEKLDDKRREGTTSEQN